MGAVHHAQLESLKGLSIGHKARTAQCPVRTVCRKLVFNRPVKKRLAQHGPGIRADQRSAHRGTIGIGGFGHDAVHHGAWKTAQALYP